jgi:hypothetical protein
METIIIKTENKATAKVLLAFLKTVRSVKSIKLVPDETETNVVNEPAQKYNWIDPSRPATDAEIEKMLDECETGEGFSTKEARAETNKLLEEWHRKRKE